MTGLGVGTFVLVLLLVHRAGESKSTEQGLLAKPQPDAGRLPSGPIDIVGSVGQEAAPNRDFSVDQGDKAVKPPPETREEALQRSKEAWERRLAAARDAEGKQLLAAGFSQERLDWLEHRRNELLAQFEQAENKRKEQGLPPDLLSFSVSFDKDLILQSEMSDEEYMSYRQARGDAVAITVTRVLPGSNADLAGVQQGDQIVRYDSKRVFDDRVLNLMASDASAGPATLEVVRNGQTMMLTLPKGPTGIGGSSSAGVNVSVNSSDSEKVSALLNNFMRSTR